MGLSLVALIEDALAKDHVLYILKEFRSKFHNLRMQQCDLKSSSCKNLVNLFETLLPSLKKIRRHCEEQLNEVSTLLAVYNVKHPSFLKLHKEACFVDE